MGKTFGNLVIWAPRVLCLLFTVFIGIFAADVFAENEGFLGTTLAFLIHLGPAAVVLVVLVVSWRREWFGAAVYTLLGLAYLVLAWGQFSWVAYVLISGPLFAAGILFFIGWRHRVATSGQRAPDTDNYAG